MLKPARSLLASALLFLAACGGAATPQLPDAGPADAGAIDAGPNDAGTIDAGTVDAGMFDAGTSDAGTTDAGVPSNFDPAKPGPYTVAEYDVTITAPATGDSLPLHIAYPSAGDGGPWVPLIVAHGFVLPASQYYVTARTLAAFGAIAVTVDYPTSLFAAPNHVKSAQDLSAGLDWIYAQQSSSASPLYNKVGNKAVMLGHSLGGKLAILEAAGDSRVAAVIGFDPVDGSMSCSAADCPNASSVLPLHIPSLFLGETLDEATTLGQACAPASENFQALYALAASPAAEVDIAGADHMDFLDDPSTCGATCLACKSATASHDVVIALARAEANAFIERYLRNDTSAASWIAGPSAQAAWVATGEATISSK